MTFSNELKVGVTIVISVIMLFVGVRFFQNVPLFRGSYPMVTYLDDSGGLIPGNSVRISGVKVGDVRAVELTEDGQRVRVHFTVFDGINVAEGSRARVSGLGAIGGLRLSIDPGQPGAAALPPGSTLPSEESRDVIATLSQQAPALLTRTDELLAQVTEAVGEAGGLLRGTEEDVRLTLAALRNSTDGINHLVRSHDEQIGRVLGNTETLTAGIGTFAASQSDSLGMAVGQLNHLLRRLDQNLGQLDTSMQRMDRILVGIESGDGSIGRLTQDPALYDELQSAATQLNRILEDLQRNPSRYLRDMSIIKLF